MTQRIRSYSLYSAYIKFSNRPLKRCTKPKLTRYRDDFTKWRELDEKMRELLLSFGAKDFQIDSREYIGIKVN
jgi:hypothetical protein